MKSRTRRPKIAFLFPGSGSQYLGMGRNFDADIPEVRDFFDSLARELGYDLRGVMFDGPEEDLFPTAATLAKIGTVSLFMETTSALSLAVARVFEKRGVVPDALAGRSMGEYTALMAAGCVDRATGFRLLRDLGEHARKERPRVGCVSTVFGLEKTQAEKICRVEARKRGPCEVICGYRARRMVVVGGTRTAVAEFEKQARAAGATKFIHSRQEWVAHTSLNSGLARYMAGEMKTLRLRRPCAPIWCNYDARPAVTERVLRRRLAAQLDHPVFWEETIAGLVATGTKFFVELAPGRMLTDFLVPLPDGVEVLPTDTPQRLRAALERLKAAGLTSS